MRFLRQRLGMVEIPGLLGIVVGLVLLILGVNVPNRGFLVSGAVFVGAGWLLQFIGGMRKHLEGRGPE